MQNILNVVITFNDKRVERYNQVGSARAKDGYYQVLTKEGQNIMIPLPNIKRILENSVDEGETRKGGEIIK